MMKIRVPAKLYECKLIEDWLHGKSFLNGVLITLAVMADGVVSPKLHEAVSKISRDTVLDVLVDDHQVSEIDATGGRFETTDKPAVGTVVGPDSCGAVVDVPKLEVGRDVTVQQISEVLSRITELLDRQSRNHYAVAVKHKPTGNVQHYFVRASDQLSAHNKARDLAWSKMRWSDRDCLFESAVAGDFVDA